MPPHLCLLWWVGCSQLKVQSANVVKIVQTAIAVVHLQFLSEWALLVGAYHALKDNMHTISLSAYTIIMFTFKVEIFHSSLRACITEKLQLCLPQNFLYYHVKLLSTLVGNIVTLEVSPKIHNKLRNNRETNHTVSIYIAHKCTS